MLVLFNSPQGSSSLRMEHTAIVLLSLFLLVSPFPHTQLIGELCFYSTLLIFAILSFRFGVTVEKHLVLASLLLFGGWSIISSVFALNPIASLNDFYSHLVKYFILAAMLVAFFGSRRGLVLLSWILVVSGGVFSIFIGSYFYGVLGHDFSIRLGQDLPRWPIDPMGFVMLFSLSLIFPLCRHAERKSTIYFLNFVAIVLMVTAILTQSRATFLGMVVVLSISCFRNLKLLTVLLVLLFSSVYFLSPLSNRLTEGDNPRVALILYSMEIIKDYPVSGIGFSLDTFRDPQYINQSEYSSRIPENYRKVIEFHWPHNILIDVAVRTGIPGLLIFSGFLGLMFRQMVKLAHQGQDQFIRDWAVAVLASLSMFIVKGSFEPVFMHFVEVIFYATLAMLTILARLQRELAQENGSSLFRVGNVMTKAHPTLEV